MNPRTDKQEIDAICREIWALVERVHALGYDIGYTDGLAAVPQFGSAQQLAQKGDVRGLAKILPPRG